MSEKKGWKSGTTAIISIIHGDHLVSAGVGDSKSVLYRNGKPFIMNELHCPASESEKLRIEELGGIVVFFAGAWRVNGIIGVFSFLLSCFQFSIYCRIRVQENRMIRHAHRPNFQLSIRCLSFHWRSFVQYHLDSRSRHPRSLPPFSHSTHIPPLLNSHFSISLFNKGSRLHSDGIRRHVGLHRPRRSASSSSLRPLAATETQPLLLPSKQRAVQVEAPTLPDGPRSGPKRVPITVWRSYQAGPNDF